MILAGHVGNVDTSDAGEGADPISGVRLVYSSVGADPYLTVTHVNNEAEQTFFVDVIGVLASERFRGKTGGGDATNVPITVSATYLPHHQSLEWEGTLDVSKSPVKRSS